MTINTATTRSTSTPTAWKIDPSHSEVGFSVKHLMIANVRGRFGALDGEINLDETNIERSSVNVAIEASSIDTREQRRDDHLRSADFFDVLRFPQLVFRSDGVQRTGDDRLRVSGLLTIRDVTKAVVLDVREEGRGTDPWGGQRAAFTATTSIDRRDFGLTWNQALETGGVLVGNEIRITLEVETIRT